MVNKAKIKGKISSKYNFNSYGGASNVTKELHKSHNAITVGCREIAVKIVDESATLLLRRKPFAIISKNSEVKLPFQVKF